MSFHAETADAGELASASLVARPDVSEDVRASGVYHVECLRDGAVVWEDDFPNLVVTVGKNSLLDNYLAGSAYTAAFYLALVDGGSTPTYNAADTMASHSGWTENVGYSGGVRPTVSWSAASAGSKSSSAVTFNITATGTIAGAFLTTNSTQSGTTGTLYSAGNFSAGSRSVLSGDSLLVTYTASA